MSDVPSVNRAAVRVVTPVLRSHAGRWDSASSELTRHATEVSGLTLAGIPAGPFADFAGRYAGLVEQLRDRLTEAARATAAIADTLVDVANFYDAHDSDSEHSLSRLHEG